MLSDGYCIDQAVPELLKTERAETGAVFSITGNVDVHDAGARPDAVDCDTDVRSGQVVGHGPLEEQGVVFDLHVAG